MSPDNLSFVSRDGLAAFAMLDREVAAAAVVVSKLHAERAGFLDCPNRRN